MGLATRGYVVTLFEARPQLLDRLRSMGEGALPASVIEADLAVLKRWVSRCSCEPLISRHAGPFGLDAIVRDFDALYLAPGPEVLGEDALGLTADRAGQNPDRSSHARDQPSQSFSRAARSAMRPRLFADRIALPTATSRRFPSIDFCKARHSRPIAITRARIHRGFT